MLVAIIDSFGICLGYVTIMAVVSMIWDIVVRAFTRGIKLGTQYQDVSSLPSAVYRDYILSYADMWDHYVIYQSDQYEFIGYVWDDWDNSTLIRIYRVSESGYNNRWRTSIQYDIKHKFTIIEPMYAYSTEKEYGQYYLPQNMQAASAISQLILTVTIIFVLMFRGCFYENVNKTNNHSSDYRYNYDILKYISFGCWYI